MTRSRPHSDGMSQTSAPFVLLKAPAKSEDEHADARLPGGQMARQKTALCLVVLAPRRYPRGNLATLIVCASNRDYMCTTYSKQLPIQKA